MTTRTQQSSTRRGRTNRQRADAARAALDAPALQLIGADEPLEARIVDLIADLAHLCDFEGLVFGETLRLAKLHHRAEADGRAAEDDAAPNYPTHLADLWLHNDEPTYRRMRGMIEEARRDSSTAWRSHEGVADAGVAARSLLAERLQAWFEAEAPDLGATFWSDLLGDAARRIDWRRLAESLLADE